MLDDVSLSPDHSLALPLFVTPHLPPAQRFATNCRAGTQSGRASLMRVLIPLELRAEDSPCFGHAACIGWGAGGRA